MRKCEKKTEKFVIEEVCLISNLSFYLVRFVANFAGRSCFCFVRSFTIGFVIGKMKSKDGDVTFGFF